MGCVTYRIVYETEKRNKANGRGLRRLIMTVCFFVCFLWLVGAFWPQGQFLLRELLLPGDPTATLEAAEVFAQEMSSGFALKDAAENFMNTVLNHGYQG